MRIRSFTWLPVLIALSAAPAAAQSKSAGTGTQVANLSITVAIVLDNLEVKPVPLLELWVTSTRGGDPRVIRTRLDGTAAIAVPPGSYRIEGAQPVPLNGTSYEWNVTINAPAGEARVELTNQNATTRAAGSAAVVQAPGTGFTPSSPTLVAGPGSADAGSAEAVPASATGVSAPDQPAVTATIVSAGDPPGAPAGSAAPARQRQMAPEMEVYRQVRAGVFRIEAGLSRGTGFLVDTAGFILTNAHVVSGQSRAAAALDSATRVEAQIVYRDDERDVAVLRVSPAAVRGRPALQLSVGTPLVDPGERVFAVGYPLNQEQTLTSGIVSGLREGAIISDVNINHGNSGGPLMNLAGEVVGINTFGDFTPDGGPGISGAILATRAIEPLSIGRGKAATLPMPSPTPLPSLPLGRFTTHELKAFADSVKISRYEAFDSISVGKFEVALTTPPITYVREKAFEQIVGKDRKKREARAHLDENARYSELRESRDWQEYVGDDRAPVIALTVEPKLGETSGSVFRRLLVTGVNGKTTVRYSGDLEAAYVYRNGQAVVPLTGGTTPVKQYVDNQWVDLKDVANYGFYVLAADVFAPGPDGAPPSIVIELADLKNPGNESCRELPAEIVATAWNDFALYHAGRGEPFTPADPKTRPAQAPNVSAVCAASRKARNAPPAERSDAPNPMGGIRP